MNYNLLDKEWIPVLYRNGDWKRVGIRKALEDAGRIREIAASNPMDRVAILRFLLAILYWCKGNPPEGENEQLEGSFPTEWFAKLEENRDCFDLLGDGKRFYQDQRVSTGRESKLAANYLIHEVPTGRNAWHFRHSIDEVDGLCLACCALGLLRLPLFATSGGRGKPPGINAKPPVYAIPIGSCLAATLRLSWCEKVGFGIPSWESVGTELPSRGQVPILTGMTWLPRRVWLDDPEAPVDFCVACGRRELLVRRCVFAGIGSSKTGDKESGRTWRDPHVLYAPDAKGIVNSLHAGDALGASDAAAAQWAKVVSAAVQNEGGSRSDASRARMWIVGFSTVQNDKYLEAIEFVLQMPDVGQRLPEAIGRIENWQKEGRRLQKRIHKSESISTSVVNAVRPHVETVVSGRAGGLISGDSEGWQAAAETYRPLMQSIARSLAPGVAVEAVQWRRHISNVTPDMRTQTESVKKPRRRKGGAS